MPWHNLPMSGYYRPKSFVAERSLGYLVKRCAVMMTDLAERAFAEHGVPFTQWLTLMKLRKEAPISVGELACALGHDQGALTRVVDALVKAGMVERQRSAADRRSVELRLTDSGQTYVEDQLPIAVDALNHVLESFSHEEVDSMLDLLARLLQRLTEVKADADVKTTRQESSS